jgi:hypothetical protein
LNFKEIDDYTVSVGPIEKTNPSKPELQNSVREALTDIPDKTFPRATKISDFEPEISDPNFPYYVSLLGGFLLGLKRLFDSKANQSFVRGEAVSGEKFIA